MLIGQDEFNAKLISLLVEGLQKYSYLPTGSLLLLDYHM